MIFEKKITILSKEFAVLKFYPYKRKDNIHLSDDLIQKGLLKILIQISFHNYLMINNNLF